MTTRPRRSEGILIPREDFRDILKRIRYLEGVKPPTPGGDGGGGGGATYEDLVLAEASLIAYWPCEDLDTGAVDIVGTVDMTGGANTAYRVPGPFADSYAIESRGNSGYLEDTGASELDVAFDGTHAYTIEGWWKLVDPQDVQGIFMFNYAQNGGTSGGTNQIALTARATATYAYRGSTTFAFPSIPRMPVNVWAHVAYTYDGTNMRVYVGGVLGVTQATGTNVNAGDALVMGTCTVEDYNHLHGIAVYSTALSQATLAEHATAQELQATGTVRIVPVTGAFTIPADYTDTLVLADGTFTVTLPDATLTSGVRHTIKRTGSGTITVSAAGSQPIDGTGTPGTYSLNAADKAVTVVSDGLGWRIVAAYL